MNETLSDTRNTHFQAEDSVTYEEEDIKKFIKEIKQFIWDTMGDNIEKRERILMFIEEKAGDKLI